MTPLFEWVLRLEGQLRMEQKLVVTHVEWSTSEPVQLTNFLSGLFGWKFERSATVISFTIQDLVE